MSKSKLDADDLVSALEFFEELEDPRSHVNRLHNLGDILVICVCAVICGADGPKAIGMWAQAQEAWLCKYLLLPNGVPSHDTIARVLATLDAAAFQSCFSSWIESLQTSDEENKVGPAIKKPPIETIAIDGKALRRSHDRRRGLNALFLVSAWSTRCGISLGQLATEEKSNEITAIPVLIEQINVAGAIVTIDAAGCQREIADKIIEGKGDYVLTLKGNQGTLHENVANWIGEQFENDFQGLECRQHKTTSDTHGRDDTFMYHQFSIPNDFPGKENWRGLKTVGVAIRASVTPDGKESCDVRYFISSLALGVKQFAHAIRSHWKIENSLHWCLDVTFREDECRVRNRIAAENLAWLKRFAISLLKQVKDKESIAMRRRMAGWNVDYLAQILGLKAP